MHLLHPQESSQHCRWHRFDTAAELERAAIAEILRTAQQAIGTRGEFHIVLAGGTTPQRVYKALSEAKAAWNSWYVYFGDERCLPPAHGERNSHMAAQAWLGHVSIPAAQVYPIPAEEGALPAAEKYARIVNKVALFDLVLLGLGEDGHTASLFPGHDAGDTAGAPDTLAVLDAPKPPPQRVSLSAQRLGKARKVIFLVTGSGKSQAARDWYSSMPIPASKIAPANGVDVYIEGNLLA